MPRSPSSPTSTICKDLTSTLSYDAELRSNIHLMSLSMNCNAHLPIDCLEMESIVNDWSRVLVLEQVARNFDEFDAVLRRDLQGDDLCQDHGLIHLSLPDYNSDHLVLDDVVFSEMSPPAEHLSRGDAHQPTRPVPNNPRNGGPVRPAEADGTAAVAPAFMTASERLRLDEETRLGGRKRTSTNTSLGGGGAGGGPGLSKSALSNMKRSRTGSNQPETARAPGQANKLATSDEGEFVMPPELEGLNLSVNLVQNIISEIMDKSPSVQWHHIAGLEFAKKCIREIVVWPMLRPDLFKGLRGPPKGLLLFGPPGTGKTMIGRAIASECQATFFSISASSLTSKWHGESEKLVRTLFAVARCYQPAVIFVDEIDSLLAQRSDSEFEGSRRLKTEFLVQLDGAATCKDDRVLLIGATNRPQELDEAARRRLVKRLFIPLPNADARRVLIRHLLAGEAHELGDEDDGRLDDLIQRTKGYSGADINALCTEASYGPIRDLPNIADIRPDQVRPISYDDFQAALAVVRASVSLSDLGQYHDWNDQFGSFAIDPVIT